MEVNRRRRRHLGISSILRALIERALDFPGDALEFDAKVVRPDRIYRDRAAQRIAAAAASEAVDLFRRVSDVVERRQLTPLEFFAELGGDRRDAEHFYHRGALPEGDSKPLLDRVKEWLHRTEEACQPQPNNCRQEGRKP
jgi:hypothetical protein